MDNREIMAIPTHYRDTMFRSRTEARWAVFFDACGIGWRYEQKWVGVLEGRSYLPDFWLPSLRIVFAVKGASISAEEVRDLSQASSVLKGRAIYALGAPKLPDPDEDLLPGAISTGIYDVHPWKHGHTEVAFCRCEDCGSIGIEARGHGDYACLSGRHKERPRETMLPSWDEPLFREAFQKALRIRF